MAGLGDEKPRVTKKLVWDLKFKMRDDKKPARRGRLFKSSTDVRIEVCTQCHSNQGKEYSILTECVGFRSPKALGDLGGFQLQ